MQATIGIILLTVNKDIKIIDDLPISKETKQPITSLHRFRFVIAIYELSEIELGPSLNPDANYFLTFTVLSNVFKYKLRFDHWAKYGIDYTPINRIKMIYFFAEKEDGYRWFYNLTCPLRIAFWWENTEIGNIELQLKEVSYLIK